MFAARAMRSTRRINTGHLTAPMFEDMYIVYLTRQYENRSDLELSFAKILIYTERIFVPDLVLDHQAWQTLRELINLTGLYNTVYNKAEVTQVH
jgi:hypothetical protein